MRSRNQIGQRQRCHRRCGHPPGGSTTDRWPGRPRHRSRTSRHGCRHGRGRGSTCPHSRPGAPHTRAPADPARWGAPRTARSSHRSPDRWGRPAGRPPIAAPRRVSACRHAAVCCPSCPCRRAAFGPCRRVSWPRRAQEREVPRSAPRRATYQPAAGPDRDGSSREGPSSGYRTGRGSRSHRLRRALDSHCLIGPGRQRSVTGAPSPPAATPAPGTIDHAGRLVTRHSPEEQNFTGRTFKEALAWCLVWLMARTIPSALVAQPSPIVIGFAENARSCDSCHDPFLAPARNDRARYGPAVQEPRAVRSRQSTSSSRAVSAVLMSRSSCPRLAGTLQRSSFPGPGRTSNVQAAS